MKREIKETLKIMKQKGIPVTRQTERDPWKYDQHKWFQLYKTISSKENETAEYRPIF